MKLSKDAILRIAFPALGAFGGFVAFLASVSYANYVFSILDNTADLLGPVAGTFVAAWAGGWAAFASEGRRRERAERNARISAANKALFVVATMFNVFDNLRQFYIDKGQLRSHPDRALLIDSPQPGMMQNLHFDFDSLNYFLDVEGDVASMALMELQLLEWHYAVLKNTIELRAKAVEDLHMRMRDLQSNKLEPVRTVFRMEYSKAEALTDQLVHLVDDGISLTRRMDKRMQSALQHQFPGQGFLQIKFAQESTEPAPATP